MIVSFWSPYPGKGSTTITTLLTSLAFSVSGGSASTLVTTTRKDDSFKNMFESKINVDDYVGIDGVEQLLQSTKLTESALKDQTITLYGDLDMLPWKKTTSDKIILDFLPTYLKSLDVYDLTFMDLGGGELTEINSLILDKSVVVVVCVEHNSRHCVETRRIIKEIRDKGATVFVVVERFDAGSKPTLTNMRIDMGLGKNDIYYIPYISYVKDLTETGNLLNIVSKFQEPSPRFMKEPLHKLKDELVKLSKEIKKKGGF